jgi:hypothetical protein
MAIIYSYPEVTSLQATDRFIISRFPSGSGEISNYNLDLDTLSSYINTGQATVIQVDDRVVTGASFNTGSGLITLTRNGGDIPSVTTNLDGRYALTSSLATVATSGSYNDLSDQPTIPVDSVNGQTGTVVLTTSNLTNDSGYIEGTTTSQTAITEIKTLTSGEYASETKSNNVMYVIV